MTIKRICGDFDPEKEIPVAFCGTFENLHSFELKTDLNQKISYSEFSMAFKKDEILFDEKEKIFFLSESDEETMQDKLLICAQAYGGDSIYLQSISKSEKIIGGGTLRRNNGKYILSVQKLFQGCFVEYASKLAVLHGRLPSVYYQEAYHYESFYLQETHTRIDASEIPGFGNVALDIQKGICRWEQEDNSRKRKCILEKEYELPVYGYASFKYNYPWDILKKRIHFGEKMKTYEGPICLDSCQSGCFEKTEISQNTATESATEEQATASEILEERKRQAKEKIQKEKRKIEQQAKSSKADETVAACFFIFCFVIFFWLCQKYETLAVIILLIVSIWMYTYIKDKMG